MKDNERIYYKDLGWKVGDWITCTKLEVEGNPKDFVKQHLTLGKKYKINDLEPHFPDAVCVKSDNKRAGYMFFQCGLFVSDLKDIRKQKLDKIEKKAK